MLDWVNSASRAQSGTESTTDDAPETPAHVFAARAFKNLLFGTPAATDMTVEKPKRMTKVNPSKPSRRHSSDVPRDSASRPDSFISPSKGILVAPGSVSTKRKSVTFGSLGRDANARRHSKFGGRAGQEEQIPVPTLNPLNFDPDLIEEDLRKSLFSSQKDLHVQKEKKEQPTINEPVVIPEEDEKIILDVPVEESAVVEPAAPTERKSLFLEDQTLDLDQPRSTSGQHWKREYERDHDKSKSEMKKLIRYSQLTKSYAEKRDRDAVIMTQKLDEAESKAKSLETQIRKLAAQLMDAKTHGEEQDLILSEVASQTAEVMKQKGNAEKYRAALRKYEMSQPSVEDCDDDDRNSSASDEIAELKSELLRTRLAVDRAEARAAQAEYDKSMVDTKLHQMEESSRELLQQYNRLQDRLNRKASRLLEENRNLANELMKANQKCSAMTEDLDNFKRASKENRNSTKDKLFDMEHPRFTKEPSPPTSDEDLRQRDRASYRSTVHKTDSELTEDVDNTYSHKRNGASRRLPHKKSVSTPCTIPVPFRNSARLDGRADHQFNPQAALAFESESEKEVDVGQGAFLEHHAAEKGSPLMKSFVDNLGSRRVLPPERVAAAKRRLEEKAADRRSTPMYTKVHEKIIV